jgi:hypothetical protein
MTTTTPATPATTTTATSYALASNLRGFLYAPNCPVTELRVRVLEVRDGCAFVVTADLLDVGTRLCLDPSQLTRCE